VSSQHCRTAHDSRSATSRLGASAPLDARDLKRLAARALFGLARTGSSYSNGSGDDSIAFSTSTEVRSRPGETRPVPRRILPPDAVSPLFQAALEATEESVYNALLRATTTMGSGHRLEAIPIDAVREILERHDVGR
jgi:D-aminopeptidase